MRKEPPQKVAPTSRSAVVRVSRPALTSVALLTLALPIALAAQSIQTVAPQQCVWHAGDNPAWASPNLDEAAWQPYAEWNLSGNEPRMWVRCHADLSALRGVPNPGAQVAVDAAYELYVNGQRVGGAGNMENGFSTLQVFRWAVPDADLGMHTTLALRLAYRVDDPDKASVQFGNIPILKALNDSAVLAQLSSLTLLGICYLIVGFIGLSLLGFYLSDRSRTELLLLGIACTSLGILRLLSFSKTGWPITVSFAELIFLIANVALPIGEVLFFFRLSGKRVRQPIPVLLGIETLWSVVMAVCLYAPPRIALSSLAFLAGPVVFPMIIALSMVAFVGGAILAFLPIGKLPRRVRTPAMLCLTWVAADSVWFAFELTPGGTRSHIFLRWTNVLAEARGVTVLAVVIALMALMLREQRQIAEDRALLAGEMASAREIQRYLIPEKLPPTPGLNIRSVYQPSREVGGDFFQILPDPRDGSTLIVVGDVAGKGLKAGMLAALIVGAIRTAFKFTSDPARILALLNERLQGRGLVTCLAMRIDRDGSAELANAGHLPPYINGEELALDGALPLGALPDIPFPTFHFQLSDGQSMLLLSDGVVEAQNASGQLFGFERTRQISTHSAEAIAQAAQAHGQEDDITVLTLTFAPVEVAHA